MVDYINRQVAIKEAERMAEEHQYDFVGLLISLPSEDVQPVVWCRDCVHYMPYDWMFSEVWKSKNIADYPQNEIGCEWIDHDIKPDDYCSFAERRTDG